MDKTQQAAQLLRQFGKFHTDYEAFCSENGLFSVYRLNQKAIAQIGRSVEYILTVMAAQSGESDDISLS